MFIGINFDTGLLETSEIFLIEIAKKKNSLCIFILKDQGLKLRINTSPKIE